MNEMKVECLQGATGRIVGADLSTYTTRDPFGTNRFSEMDVTVRMSNSEYKKLDPDRRIILTNVSEENPDA